MTSNTPRVQDIVFTFFGVLPLALLIWVSPAEFPNFLHDLHAGWQSVTR